MMHDGNYYGQYDGNCNCMEIMIGNMMATMIGIRIGHWMGILIGILMAILKEI